MTKLDVTLEGGIFTTSATNLPKEAVVGMCADAYSAHQFPVSSLTPIYVAVVDADHSAGRWCAGI
jgi:hypothetical protein